MDALHAEKLEASDEAVRSLVDGVFRDYDTTKSGGLTFQEFEAWLGHEPDVAALLGLEKVFALWLNGDSVEAAGRGSGRRGRRPGVAQRLRAAALEALDNYRPLLARGLYLGGCAAIVADRVVEFAVRRDAYPSLVVARVSGGLLNLHIVLVRPSPSGACNAPKQPSQKPRPDHPPPPPTPPPLPPPQCANNKTARHLPPRARSCTSRSRARRTCIWKSGGSRARWSTSTPPCRRTPTWAPRRSCCRGFTPSRTWCRTVTSRPSPPPPPPACASRPARSPRSCR